MEMANSAEKLSSVRDFSIFVSYRKLKTRINYIKGVLRWVVIHVLVAAAAQEAAKATAVVAQVGAIV